ncbi:uncharacterized protein ATNIH1004_005265 [Aspergillus tanneri]|uniref:Uncharacterized protein n=1 Tax=Aspergillus tanneri TaxID=1220188 RepID=A0A5M9MVE6_9EURO|nr:uncharacterized protein ATNIH1004_005265 [Aspergillus tanneri]KAA8649364.1 hypothetical protein ATNIH1004_005265 [Aspergillus tanneri]
MAATRPTWLITGVLSGMGKSLALEALKAGYRESLEPHATWFPSALKNTVLMSSSIMRAMPSWALVIPVRLKSRGLQWGHGVKQMVAESRQITSILNFVKGEPDKVAQAIINAKITGYDYLCLSYKSTPKLLDPTWIVCGTRMDAYKEQLPWMERSVVSVNKEITSVDLTALLDQDQNLKEKAVAALAELAALKQANRS